MVVNPGESARVSEGVFAEPVVLDVEFLAHASAPSNVGIVLGNRGNRRSVALFDVHGGAVEVVSGIYGVIASRNGVCDGVGRWRIVRVWRSVMGSVKPCERWVWNAVEIGYSALGRGGGHDWGNREKSMGYSYSVNRGGWVVMGSSHGIAWMMRTKELHRNQPASNRLVHTDCYLFEHPLHKGLEDSLVSLRGESGYEQVRLTRVSRYFAFLCSAG